jgi:hypothetical protein
MGVNQNLMVYSNNKKIWVAIKKKMPMTSLPGNEKIKYIILSENVSSKKKNNQT